MIQGIPMRIIKVIFFFLFPTVLFAQTNSAKECPLDSNRVTVIPVMSKGGVTTIFFPSPISAIRGQRIATSEQQIQNADFFLKLSPNRYYFSVYGIKENVRQNLTVIFNRVPYSLVLESSPEGQGIQNMTFVDTAGKTLSGASLKSYPKVSAARLMGILDKAKAYDLLLPSHPEALSDVTRIQPKRTIHYVGFDVFITDVFRFNEADALVFRVIIENKTEKEILYRPADVGVGVSEQLYPATLWNSSGVMSPGVKDKSGKIQTVPTLSYFVVAGNPEGGRNNLDVDNPWNVYIPRYNPDELLNPTGKEEDPLPKEGSKK
jgi:hypothetical protein